MNDLFDDMTQWTFAPANVCKIEKIYPNELAYRDDRTAFATFVKRSHSDGYALTEAGLNYPIAAKERGERKDGKPVTEAFVVLVECEATVASAPESARIVEVCTAHDMQQRVGSKASRLSNYGWGKYWWVEPENGNVGKRRLGSSPISKSGAGNSAVSFCGRQTSPYLVYPNVYPGQIFQIFDDADFRLSI